MSARDRANRTWDVQRLNRLSKRTDKEARRLILAWLIENWKIILPVTEGP